MRITGSLLTLVCTAVLAGCSSSSSTTTPTPPARNAHPGPIHSTSHGQPNAVPVESPVAAENNPPGDIPDNTQFIPYRSTKGGFVVKVPEGWARAGGTSAV